ncbi:MAG: lactate utilization protein [Spirochaetales bacterium]|nr:lactate utilization protein [Spirochaetales bacterium]
MSDIVKEYWRTKLDTVCLALERNRFDAHVAENMEDAQRLVWEELVPPLNGGTVSWGGSMTLKDAGLKRKFFESPDWEVIDVDNRELSPEERLERRRQSLLADLYFLGSNALIEDGRLVNLDMIGNRVAALTFGPKKVVVLVGRNKVCADLDSAMRRVRDYASPANARRLSMATPCAQTSMCHDCSSEQRICNNWTITEKSFPEHRISVVLINEDLGL